VGLSVLDTSVLVAFLDPDDPHHQGSVRAMGESRTRHRLVVPAVAYAESLVRAYRQGERAAQKVLGFFDAATIIEPIDERIARAAARLRAKHRIRLPDALILATGIELRADEVLTADRRWRSIDRRVKVIT